MKTVNDLSRKGKIADEFSKAKERHRLLRQRRAGTERFLGRGFCLRDLLKETGHVGRPNNGLIGVWQRVNDQGAWEVGFRPEPDLEKALKGKAVYIVGADPVGDSPALAKALRGADFVAVQDILETATTEAADVVLPAQAFTEREGTYVSGERRVQRFHAAVAPKGDSKADFAITSQVAKQMGIILEGSSASVVFDILANSIDAFAELSYARLAEVHGQWPIVGRGDLYYGGTTYENTQGLGVQLVPAAQAGEPYASPRSGKRRLFVPKEKELLAVPVTKLYDRGVTVTPAELLDQRIGEATVSAAFIRREETWRGSGPACKVKLRRCAATRRL